MDPEAHSAQRDAAAAASSSRSHQRRRVDDIFAALMQRADIAIGGDRPWDLTVHHPDTAARVLAGGSLGLGDSYMDGWWDCPRIDEMLARILAARLEERAGQWRLVALGLASRLFNLQSAARAWQVGRVHYDLDWRLFEAMLDSRLTYSCGYWAHADTLEQAQEAKLEWICRKLGLRPGMRLLDIGCGWGSLVGYAAERHGVSCVGITISAEQAAYARRRLAHLPVEIRLQDYRALDPTGREQFDRVASVGMFEHVGHKNYAAYFATVRRSLAPDGVFLLHTIGRNHAHTLPDPWITRHIFPNYELPTLARIAAACEQRFVVEDAENFGADYDRTLMNWHARLEAAWPGLPMRDDLRERRMMRYYLLACAAAFRVRLNQLWQLVLTPAGMAGGWRRPVQPRAADQPCGSASASDAR